jgi:hypothetical protein
MKRILVLLAVGALIVVMVAPSAEADNRPPFCYTTTFGTTCFTGGGPGDNPNKACRTDQAIDPFATSRCKAQR